jgi:hypothetical protein
MKTFKDLQFEPHSIIDTAVQAKMYFDNGTFISVVGGKAGSMLYGNGTTSFEVLSTVSERKPNGVDGWLSKSQVTSRMRYLQSLK